MIDTLNQKTLPTPIAVEVPEPSAASVESPRCSPKFLEDGARCHYRLSGLGKRTSVTIEFPNTSRRPMECGLP